MSILLAASAVALSLLQSDGNSCRWSRRDLSPTAKPVALATIDAPCDQLIIHFSADRRRALALIQSMDGGRARVVSLDLVKGGLVALPELPKGWFEAVAFDDRGRATALGLMGFPNEGPDAPIRDEKAETLTVRGKTYRLPRYPGSPALAHAYTLVDGKWKVTETVATTSEAGGAAGTSVLAAAKLLAAPVGIREEVVGKQIRVTTPDGVVLFADIFTEDGPDGEVVSIWSRNGYLLVMTSTDPMAVHVFEGKTGKPACSVPGVAAAQLY